MPHVPWHYNNWDFNTLGTIFERQAGTTIAEAFKRLIAEPLQMEDFDLTDLSYVGGSKSIHPAYPFRMTARDLARRFPRRHTRGLIERGVIDARPGF